MAGKYFEALEVGALIRHPLGRTITEMDNVLFTTLTMNTQPLHLNEDFARQTQFGRRIVNGIFTLGLAVGITVPDLTEGTLVANLSYESVKHPHPLYHGDTLYVETEVLSKRESRSNPDRGIVRFRHIGRNQAGTVVIDFERTALVLKQPAEEAAALPAQPAQTATPAPRPARRALLFMPGDSLRKISKAAQMDVDSIVMDLEDGVALSQKQEARRTVVEALGSLDFGRSERLVRLNPPGSDLFADDLRTTIEARPDGYVLPKVESSAQVRAVDRLLGELEQEQGWPLQSIRLLAIIETARGVLNASDIARSGQRLDALAFGAEDLAGDIGARRTRVGWEVFYARSAVITAAAAYGLQAIDTVFIDLNDLEGLAEECRVARELGYAGKMAIHPRQVEVINRIFTPTPEEIDKARRLVDAHAAQQAAGAGAFEFEGKMVDRPMVRAAERVLERARAAGLLA